ncbi:MAG: DUF4230 domain-containing protein [Oscillospiraceae bacterium]|nr:DUF4230 domain-containing protein [Oscillospiraceae bacterium]
MPKKFTKLTKPKKRLAAKALCAGITLGVLILWIVSFARSGNPYNLFQVITEKKNNDGSVDITQENVPYTLQVEFGDVILDEAQREKKLIVLTQKGTVPVQAEKKGLFKWKVFSQTKYMLFHGVGSYSVDLAKVKDTDIIVDAKNQVIEIHIPDPVLSVEYIPEDTEFLDSSNGILRFGEMEITPEMMTALETTGKEALRENFEKDESSMDTARKYAALSVKEIFEPVLKKQIDSAVEEANDQYAIPPYYSIKVIVGNGQD